MHVRRVLDALPSPLIYAQVDASAGLMLPLSPPTRHRPVAIVIARDQASETQVNAIRARLRRAGYGHQCLLESMVVSTTFCPLPATELRFNGIVGGLSTKASFSFIRVSSIIVP